MLILQARAEDLKGPLRYISFSRHGVEKTYLTDLTNPALSRAIIKLRTYPGVSGPFVVSEYLGTGSKGVVTETIN